MNYGELKRMISKSGCKFYKEGKRHEKWINPLYEYEEQGAEINPATDIKAVKAEGAEFVTLVKCDTIEYRRFYDNKSVKKTLTIPNWLNEMAQAQNINFSAVLQEALKQRLQIN